MKLLLDENLSYRLGAMLADIDAEIIHAADVNLLQTPDTDIWDYARRERCTIVTRDQDFIEISQQRGQPPKVIWISLLNPSNRDIAAAIRAHMDVIRRYHETANDAILIITSP